MGYWGSTILAAIIVTIRVNFTRQVPGNWFYFVEVVGVLLAAYPIRVIFSNPETPVAVTSVILCGAICIFTTLSDHYIFHMNVLNVKTLSGMILMMIGMLLASK